MIIFLSLLLYFWSLHQNSKASEYDCPCPDTYYCDIMHFFTSRKDSCENIGGIPRLVGHGFIYSCPKFFEYCADCKMINDATAIPPADPGGQGVCYLSFWRIIVVLIIGFLVLISILLIMVFSFRRIISRRHRRHLKQDIEKYYAEQQTRLKALNLAAIGPHPDGDSFIVLCTPDIEEMPMQPQVYNKRKIETWYDTVEKKKVKRANRASKIDQLHQKVQCNDVKSRESIDSIDTNDTYDDSLILRFPDGVVCQENLPHGETRNETSTASAGRERDPHSRSHINPDIPKLQNHPRDTTV